MTMRMWVLLLVGVLAGDAEALAVAPVLAIDPHEESPVQSQSHATAAAQPPAVVEPVSTGNPLWAIPLRQLSATGERPLFAPSRRPSPVAAVTYQPAAVPPPAPPKAVEPETPQFSLVGTVAGEGGGIAVILDQADKGVVRLKTGESHKGWALREVRGRAVVLQKGYATAVLALPVPNLTKADVPPQPGLAPPQTPPAGSKAPIIPVAAVSQASGASPSSLAAKGSNWLTAPAAAVPPPSGAPGAPANPFAPFSLPAGRR
jgi:general secretion pathway protein N